jgi:hypothetical protein
MIGWAERRQHQIIRKPGKCSIKNLLEIKLASGDGGFDKRKLPVRNLSEISINQLAA